MTEQRLLGIRLLALFFAFGAMICLITIIALLFPGGTLDPIWRLNPGARVAFQQIGEFSILLIFVVGSACGVAATGLATRARWGRRLALAILIVNLAGDLLNAFLRYDVRTLIGLPIGGAMIACLVIARR